MPVPFITGNRTSLRVPIHAPLETIWELLTTPAGISRWFALACEGEIEDGREFKLVWSQNPLPRDTTTHRVTAWDPRRRFGFTWPAVQLTFDLSRQGSVNVLKLTCSYTADAGPDAQIEELVGWTMHLMTLKSVAEGGLDLRTPGKAFGWDKGFITGM